MRRLMHKGCNRKIKVLAGPIPGKRLKIQESIYKNQGSEYLNLVYCILSLYLKKLTHAGNPETSYCSVLWEREKWWNVLGSNQ